MKGNRTNHPPKAGIFVKPSKGGRTKRHTFAMTPETWQKLRAIVEREKISLNDWLNNKVNA